MSDQDPQTTVEQPAGEGGGVIQRPEVQAGAAFVGAFLLARILKRLFD
jgi:hypothetical protein